jgi:UDP-3-O-[3-hydroxymyristoyl] glucosamine N-acyltransferase
MKEEVFVIGAEGTALNIIEQIRDASQNHSGTLDVAGIIIDSFPRGALIAGIPVIAGTGDIKRLIKESSLKFIFALFKPEKMKERYDLLESFGIPRERFADFIHPLSYFAQSAARGIGNIILSGASVHSNVVLGDFNTICSGVTIEHDSKIGNGNFFAANSCTGSKVKTGNHCFFGINSSVRENVILGDNLFTGMHSLVLNDFSDCTIAGVPAHIIRDVRK